MYVHASVRSALVYYLPTTVLTGRLVHTVGTYDKGDMYLYAVLVPGMGIHTMMMRMMT